MKTPFTKDFPLEVKALSDEGTFEGYASVFGVRDSYDEVVEPGAFVESLVRHRREGSNPLLLWQHQSSEPIGIWEDLAEDKKGLWGKGRLLKGVQKAEEAHIRLKAGAVRGLSIGYKEVEVAPREDNGPRRLLKLDLMEISIVSFPANKRSKIDSVKADDRLEMFMRALRDGEPRSVREFEEILREAGASKSMATAIASHGYAKAVRSESGGVKASVLSALKEVAQSFKAL